MNILKFALAALCLSATSASAATVNWAFDVLDTASGNGAKGSFDLNPLTNTYSNVSIRSFGGSGVVYDVQTPFLIRNLSTSTFQSLEFSSAPSGSDRTGSASVTVLFGATPSQLLAGGTLNGFFLQTYCRNSDCSSVFSPTLGGFPIVGTPVPVDPVSDVPVPPAGALLLSALGLFGWRYGKAAKA